MAGFDGRGGYYDPRGNPVTPAYQQEAPRSDGRGGVYDQRGNLVPQPYQQPGGGIFAAANRGGDPAPVAVATGGGLMDQQAYNAAQVAEIQRRAGEAMQRQNADMSLTYPGQGQQTWAQHGQEFFQPGPAQQYHSQYGGEFLRPDANAQAWERYQAQGAPVNNAQIEYDAFGARRPN